MKSAFKTKRFQPRTLELIERGEEILDSYAAAGYDMTLRQLYYQLVSAGEIPNNQKEYDKLGGVVNDARLAGLLDWEHIVDRTRSLRGLSHWDDPGQIIQAVSEQYNVDKWEGQEWRPEVWIEKDALSGVFKRICDELDVPLFSCRGYNSQSEMYAAAMRMINHQNRGQRPRILHFGDHDPSGIDMSRDIQDRLAMFGVDLRFERMALNMDQVEEYQPPPNPAKLTDSRCVGYIESYGDESWELDALESDTLAALVREEIDGITNPVEWQRACDRQDEERAQLAKVSESWDEVVEFVENGGGE